MKLYEKLEKHKKNYRQQLIEFDLFFKRFEKYTKKELIAFIKGMVISVNVKDGKN